jgi:hypothetical protein
MKQILSSDQVAKFKKDGLLVIPNFYKEEDILPIQRGIYEVIGQVMIKNKVTDTRAPFSADTFDEGYLELIKKNRAIGGEVYDAVKQIPTFFVWFHTLFMSKYFARFVKELFPMWRQVGMVFE